MTASVTVATDPPRATGRRQRETGAAVEEDDAVHSELAEITPLSRSEGADGADSTGPEADRESGFELTLRLRDPEVLEELRACGGPREREQYALAALRIGVLSMRTARGQVDAQAVRGEVEHMLQNPGETPGSAP